jgi:hypothetical protein
MSDIYAAAHLTIVAAAGQDPSYGLPGVRSRFKTHHYRCETIELVHLAACPPPKSIDIANSLWHKRAWTFQEGYYSRRRLFFTDYQMLYICQSPDVSSESMDTRAWARGPLEDCLPAPSWDWDSYRTRRYFSAGCQFSTPMKMAMKQMQAYSARKLSYDSDALKAIRGALELHYSETRLKDYNWGVQSSYHV